MMADTFNSSTWEANEERTQLQDQSGVTQQDPVSKSKNKSDFVSTEE
jgi:hypothetical protein